MSLVRSFVASLYNFAWLQSARKNFGKAFGYALIFILLASALRILPALWEIPGFIRQADRVVESELPQFTAEMSGGKLQVKDMAQPYERVFKDNDGSEIGKVVIDTVSTTTPSIESFAEKGVRSVVVLVTRDSLTTYDQATGRTKIQSWSGVPNGTWTKDDVVTFTKKFVGIMSYVIAPMLIFFLFIFFAIGKLFYLLIISLIVLAVSAIAHKGWKYAEIYTVGLYAITMPTLVSLVLEKFRLHPPFLYTVILLTYMLVALFNVGSGTAVETPSQETTPQNKV